MAGEGIEGLGKATEAGEEGAGGSGEGEKREGGITKYNIKAWQGMARHGVVRSTMVWPG